VAYAKAVVVGFVAAFLACAIWVLATFILPLMLPMFIERLSPATTGGVGMSVAYISSGPLVLIAVIAFAGVLHGACGTSPRPQVGLEWRSHVITLDRRQRFSTPSNLEPRLK
jgi:predicted Na+-dependent transporter